ncbi:MAG: tetratricopeptide repeat protein [Pedococcus sp.]
MGILRRGDAKGRRGVRKQIDAATRSGDLEAVRRLQAERIEREPHDFWPWFEAGLTAKAQHEWEECARLNAEASARIDTVAAREGFDGSNPGAWNRGIALTALGRWQEARQAWADYGLETGAGEEEIRMDWGTIPIRLNPDQTGLAFAKPPLDDPDAAIEVVWCARLSPAHVEVVNVPTPETGHRFGDVLLVDGVPSGERRLGEETVPVFDELAVLRRSVQSTSQAVLYADDVALDALAEEAFARGLGVDDWSRIRMYCSACSHGLPDPDHDHPPKVADDARRVGLGGEVGAVRALLDDWAAEDGREVVSFEVIWE